jgi:hypothetical protein
LNPKSLPCILLLTIKNKQFVLKMVKSISN